MALSDGPLPTNVEYLTAQRDALVEIMRGVLFAEREGTSEEERRLAWKRLNLAVELHDKRIRMDQ